MWVWIPRFNAVTPSNYNGGTKEKPNAIDVTFVKQNEPAIDAFTFGNKELSGFWYGKFETSHTTLASSTTDNNLGCTNDEWGAVAYLTQSIYGRCTDSTTCTEIGINNNSNYITGYGAPARSDKTVSNGAYNTTLGKDASTTKNIYGIYDMSGGANEFVMGVLSDTSGKPRSGNSSSWNSGFTGMLENGTTYTGIPFPNSKYYNLYTGSSYQGHALTETAGWYSDDAYFVSTRNPWFTRGGSCTVSVRAGVFDFNYLDGSSTSDYSSRLVISNE